MRELFAVVLNWCNLDDTITCIETLVADGLPLEQIVIVDNGSPDGSGAALHTRFPECIFLQTGENLGYAAGNNAGAQVAIARGAEWILILNNDTVVEPGMLAALQRATDDPRCAAVGPKILRHDDPSILWWDGGAFSVMRALGRHWGENHPDRPTDDRSPSTVSFLTGCCLLLRVSAIRSLEHLFDPTYFAYVEDAELGLRLRHAGWRLLYQPQARLRHKVPPHGTAPAPWALQRRDRNRRRLAATHYGLWKRAAFITWFYPTRLLTIGRYLLHGDRPRAIAVFAGTFRP